MGYRLSKLSLNTNNKVGDTDNVYTSRRGVSTFVAALLLMVLAVTAGTLIGANFIGYLGGLPNVDGQGTLFVDSASVTTGSGGKLTMYIRNAGKTVEQPSQVYIDDKQLTVSCPPINPGSVGVVNVSFNGFVSGMSYSIQLFCSDNTKLSFDIRA